MKKTILSIALLISGISMVWANNSGDEFGRASVALHKDFANARNVSWQVHKGYYKASFTYNNQILFAYFQSGNNELIAVSRNILSSDLPINLSRQLKSKYASDYWVIDLFEMAADGQTNYYVTLENADEQIVLKSSDSDWQIYKETKKR
jgi:hypothetical protein